MLTFGFEVSRDGLGGASASAAVRLSPRFSVVLGLSPLVVSVFSALGFFEKGAVTLEERQPALQSRIFIVTSGH